eukprot:COSAG06_NODE_44488_length_363_cov_0.632576_1_plen_36_part_10
MSYVARVFAFVGGQMPALASELAICAGSRLAVAKPL